MAIKLGMEARLYRNTGTYAVPSWTEIEPVKDVTINLETGEADVTTRGNDGWRATQATLKDGSIEFEAIWDDDDAGFAALQTAYFANSTIEILALNDEVTESGATGLRATMSVTNFTRNEPLEEAITASVTLKPAYSENAPEWYEVS